ncbi:MAG TPA: hypothetical protein DDY68_05960 [Porphyromonadaceae bacterium]|nr:hypothetical protein [Porphyromonadaceae bacterium]
MRRGLKGLIGFLSIVFVGGVGFYACNDANCPENVEAPLRIAIANSRTKSQSTFENLEIYHKGKRDTILSISLWGIGEKKDSAIYTNKTGINRLDVTLHVEKEISKYRLSYALKSKDTIADTFTIYHRNYPYYLSDKCPCLMYYHLDSVLHSKHLIHDYSFINQNVTNEKELHVKISY